LVVLLDEPDAELLPSAFQLSEFLVLQFDALAMALLSPLVQAG
jgi:hypothetical protein